MSSLSKLNEIDMGAYVKKIGTKNTIWVVTNTICLVAIVGLGVFQIKTHNASATENTQKLTDLQQNQFALLKQQKDVNNLDAKVTKLKKGSVDKDLSIQAMKTMKAIENLTIQYSFVNTKNEVGKIENEETVPQLPITLEFVGAYDEVASFIQDLNNTELPISLRGLELYIPEKERDTTEKVGKVKVGLTVLVFKDNMNLQKIKYKADVNSSQDPFGYFYVKQIKKDDQSIDAYQQYLQEYAKDQVTQQAQTQTQDSSTTSASVQASSATGKGTNDASNVNPNPTANFTETQKEKVDSTSQGVGTNETSN